MSFSSSTQKFLFLKGLWNDSTSNWKETRKVYVGLSGEKVRDWNALSICNFAVDGTFESLLSNALLLSWISWRFFAFETFSFWSSSLFSVASLGVKGENSKIICT